jgi:anaerobic selenocysteine-containing dehydrogenase
MVSSEDMRARDLHEGQKVTLTSHFEGETRTARSFIVVPYDIPTGNVATYFPEANALVPIGSYAERSRTPTSKAVAVTIRPEPRG